MFRTKAAPHAHRQSKMPHPAQRHPTTTNVHPMAQRPHLDRNSRNSTRIRRYIAATGNPSDAISYESDTSRIRCSFVLRVSPTDGMVHLRSPDTEANTGPTRGGTLLRDAGNIYKTPSHSPADMRLTLRRSVSVNG